MCSRLVHSKRVSLKSHMLDCVQVHRHVVSVKLRWYCMRELNCVALYQSKSCIEL